MSCSTEDVIKSKAEERTHMYCTVYPARSASVVMLQQCLPPAQHLLVFRVRWMQVEIPPCQECSVLLPSTVSAYL